MITVFRVDIQGKIIIETWRFKKYEWYIEINVLFSSVNIGSRMDRENERRDHSKVEIAVRFWKIEHEWRSEQG